VTLEVIKHPPPRRPPNLADYEASRDAFSWDSARNELGRGLGRGINIAHVAVDRHAAGARRDKIAIRWLGRAGAARDLSFAELAAQSNRFANVLASLGVRPGDAVFAVTGRIPELYIGALGTWKARAVFCTLFSAFGPEPIRARLAIGNARVLVTTAELYRKKIAAIRADLPGLEHVLVVGDGAEHIAGAKPLDALLAWADESWTIPPTDAEDLALLHFTSGTTGPPKGAMHVHDAVVAHHVTGKLALDLQEDDVYWCTADPGWVTGTSYGIIAPLTNGVTSIVDEADFDAVRWYEILERERVTVWYTAPTAIRMMMKAGLALAKARSFPRLRFLASVGEPLNPEAVRWGVAALGLPFHDNWWQTETGGIMVANFAALDIRPGSMGKPLPGIDAAIVDVTTQGVVRLIEEPGVQGELAIRTPWPSMFRGYLGAPERYAKCFADGWYLSGDLARRDADGYFWFVGRMDDVIKTSGHIVGPFEVESVLMEHPAVAEAGVIGKPDALAGEVVKAFVAVKTGVEPSEALKRSVLAHARTRLGAAVSPKEIEFQSSLPKTRSGKIMRRLLKARELGLPEGDLSTLE